MTVCGGPQPGPDPGNPEDLESLIQADIGRKIRELRDSRTIKAQDLAREAGISQGYLSKIEHGRAAISIRVLTRLCRILNRPLGYLFQSEEEIPRVLGTLITVKGPEHMGVQRFVDRVSACSNNRVSLIRLKASQLGGSGDQIERLTQGVIDLFIEEVSCFQRLLPEFGLLSFPYLFRDAAHRQAFFSGRFFKERFEGSLRNQGIRFLNPRWNWVRGLEWVLVSSRPVSRPEDVRGMRVRIQDSEVLARLWKAMGAQPVVVPWPEVRKVLREGSIDILPTHKAHLYPMGFCRYARYVTLLGDTPPVLGIAMNEMKFRMLSPSIQECITGTCDRFGEEFSRLIREAETVNEAVNMERYRAVYLKVDQDPWKRRIADIRRRLIRSGVIRKELWDQVGGLLTAG